MKQSLKKEVSGHSAWVLRVNDMSYSGSESGHFTRLETRTKESGMTANISLGKVTCIVKANWPYHPCGSLAACSEENSRHAGTRKIVNYT